MRTSELRAGLATADAMSTGWPPPTEPAVPRLAVRPGDVLATRGGGVFSRLIRFGAAIVDRPNLQNHIAVVSHYDAAGTLWGIEGRPGGVGTVDTRHYLDSPWTISNIGQPKTGDQRAAVVEVVTGMLGRPYDWAGIVADAMRAVHVQALWAQDWHGQGPPAHVVCSSLADYCYAQVGLDSPGGSRFVTPGDWAEFITTHRYEELSPA